MQPLKLMSVGWMLVSLHVHRLRALYGISFAIAALLVGGLWYALFAPVAGFPRGATITVAPGASVRHEAAALRDAHLIRSTWLFRALYRVMPGTHGVQSGKYVFMQPVGEWTVAWNLAHGIAGVPTVKVTFPEGSTFRQMGDVLAHSLPNFDGERFKSLAQSDEGSLFPDTYFFLPATTEEEAVAQLHDNYEAHIQKYADAIAASGHTERDIITMASLLEGEGKTLEDRRMIAGILWKRLSIGMPLQVDAAFGVVYGISGYVPTAADLKSNSAYNTYRYKGLPPTPINNPGEVSIEAALTPTKSDYLYYLTGTDGQMHYAKTLAEHVANQKKYLK